MKTILESIGKYVVENPKVIISVLSFISGIVGHRTYESYRDGKKRKQSNKSK